ncbi:MAG TPA: hypothetical protein VG294_14640 [Solirubrobacteraceae bacterium]|jgi:hypothetical protein|nr:hypothetical protein [Solirubrobacteraceae bacterium]
MAGDPTLIIQVPRGGEIDRWLTTNEPAGAASGEVVIERGPTDSRGHLEPPAVGEVVLSVLSPEALAREADEVRRVLRHPGTGIEPLVIVIEAGEELRDEELTPLLEAARKSPREVILRIIRDA